MKAFLLMVLVLSSGSLASAQFFSHILTYTCQVPGFLSFSIEKKYPGFPGITIQQKDCGLQRGPATTLARSLRLLPAANFNVVVETLHVVQEPWATHAPALFTLTDGSQPYSAVTLTLENSSDVLVSILAQENLCSQN
jgi:hypothetical protein